MANDAKGTSCGHNPENCELCSKSGLPVLLTRYAIAQRDSGQLARWYNDISYESTESARVTDTSLVALQFHESRAPELSGSFHVETGGPKIDLGKSAGYIQRLMRSGYLYVYNPNDKDTPWHGYIVTANSFYLPFMIDENGPHEVSDKLQEESKTNGIAPCKLSTSPEMGRLVTLRFDKQSGSLKPVYFAFSDVQWTKAVWKKHNANEDGYRDRNMRKFDLQQWIDTATHDHVAVIDEVKKYVAGFDEWNLNRNSFEFSTDIVPITSRQYTVRLIEMVSKRCESMKYKGKTPKGVILALDDPAGIVADLGRLAEFRHEYFQNRVNFAGKIAINAQIKSIYDAFSHQSDMTEGMKAALQRQEDYIDSLMLPTEYIAGDKDYEDCEIPARELTASEQKIWQDKGKPTCEEIMDARENCWKKYKNKLDEEKREKFIKSADEETAAFMKDQIAPLAEAITNWFKTSGRLKDYLVCSFDSKDPECCNAYTLLVAHMVSSTQQWDVCSEYYAKCLSSDDVLDKGNFVLRALVYNNDTIGEIFKLGSNILEKFETATFSDVDAEECDLLEVETLNNKATPDDIKAKLTALHAKTVTNVTKAEYEKWWKETWISLSQAINESIGNILGEGKGTQTLAKGGKVNDTVLGRFVAQLVGPASRLANALAVDGKFHPGLVAAFAHNRTPAIKLTITGTKAEIIKVLAATFMKISPAQNVAGSNKMLYGAKPEIAKRLAVLFAESPEMMSATANGKFTIVVGIKERMFELMQGEKDKLLADQNKPRPRLRQRSSALTISNQFEVPARLIYSIPAEIDLSETKQLDDVIRKNILIAQRRFRADQLHERVKFARGFNRATTGAGLIIQIISFSQIMKEFDQVKDGEKNKAYYEAWTKFQSSIVATIGVSIDSVGAAMKEQVLTKNFRVIRFVSVKYSNFIRTGGRLLGIPMAFVSAFWDFSNAKETLSKGQSLMAVGYAVSGTAVAVSGVMLLFAISNPYGWVLFIGSAVLSVVLSHFKDDPYQEWLGKTPWGIDDIKFWAPINATNELNKLFGNATIEQTVEAGSAVYAEPPKWVPEMRKVCTQNFPPD